MERVVGNRKQLAAEALASGSSFVGAAAVAGCSERTVRAWWHGGGEFRQAVAAARAERFEDARHRVKAACSEAVESLRTVLGDESVAPSTRVRAAQVILDVALRVHEIEDMEQRLAELERVLGARDAA